jgi:isocitrate dehydrogenase kinase/phosphatase
MYLQAETDPEAVRRVILDFGFFLKDLAASGIFPSDLFNIWNYGVIQFSRVVLFDYDDVIPIEEANFKIKPKPRDSFEELFPEEEWIVASPNDFFIDEMKRFSGIPLALKGLFLSMHNDLYTLDFWQSMKRRVSHGDIVDIIPYDRRKRFVNRYRSL